MSKPPFRASSGRTENKIHRQGKRAEEGKVEPPKKKKPKQHKTPNETHQSQSQSQFPNSPRAAPSCLIKSCGFPFRLSLSRIASCKKPHRIARSRLTATGTTIPPAPLLAIDKQQWKKEGRKKKEEEKNPEEVSEGGGWPFFHRREEMEMEMDGGP